MYKPLFRTSLALRTAGLSNKYLNHALGGCSHAVSTVDCRDPNNASSEVIVQYSSTRVSSVIFYQCRPSGFAPSSSSAVCMESGRWNPDPSQVVCRMVTTTVPIPTGRQRTVALGFIMASGIAIQVTTERCKNSHAALHVSLCYT